MNCTRVIHVLNPGSGSPTPIMPVDMAMRICLASSPPLHSFFGDYDNSCLSPASLSAGCCSGADVTMATSISCQARLKKKKKKKEVVFADSRGLSLTAIHVFNDDEDDPLDLLQFHLTEIGGATAEFSLRDVKDPADCGSGLVLDFTQPAADYLDLRNRLKTQQVCLETCSVQDRLLSGTVQVRNICFEKSVSVRITFDSWKSFQDVECQYVNNVYGCPDTDIFSFSISAPDVLEQNTVQFCIQYRTNDRTFWDNNLGNNYRLVLTGPNSKNSTGLEIQRDHSGENREDMEFNPFGSPRTLAGIFPEWQSWGCVETSAPYW
ncbi:protein phosphatase 1 regulatory subunit 3C-B-like [Mugil cephalus]|uniref:protein phosphatase 1 regulatory subunit 3C-B-like n=1 Tax=Mugil cephalus TaxID=48193 RepID=UPI001FB8118E|nr:protein phosphatase 1 regulatory subunit 3C-B-like [Mugil cephalus]